MANRERWEYLIIPETERDRLHELGLVGWELIAIGGSDTDRIIYLKRAEPDLRERVTVAQRDAYYATLGIDRAELVSE